MKKITIIAAIMIASSGTAMAYGYQYDQVDAMAYMQQAAISAREQAEVQHELREGDFREAQQIIQRDEAMKYQIRQQEAIYDQIRDMNNYGYGYGYDDR